MQNVDIGMSRWIKNWARKTINFELTIWSFPFPLNTFWPLMFQGVFQAKTYRPFKGCEGEVGIAEDIVVYDRGGTRTSHAWHTDQIQIQ